MTIRYIKGKNGYDIPYLEKIKGDEKKVVIMIHGFSGSKSGPTAELLFSNLPQHDIGVITFDLPQHGESPAGGDELRINNCIKDIIAVEEYTKKRLPEAELYYFASSYGAYITMIYLTMYEHSGTKAFFRSAAVNMPERFMNLPDNEQRQFDEQGWAMIDHGYDHPMKIVRGFIEDLRDNNLFKLYNPCSGTETFMVHTDTDEVIEFAKAKAFADKFNIPLAVISGADHSLSSQFAKDILMKNCLKFYEE